MTDAFDWRTELRRIAKDPARLPFLEAVVQDVAAAARDAGDNAPPGVIEGQAALAAVGMLVAIHWMDATIALDASERRAGHPCTTTGDEWRRVAEIPQRLRDDPVLLEAFERRAGLLGPVLASPMHAAVLAAHQLSALHPPTRSRFELNARNIGPEMERALRNRFEPIERRIDAYDRAVSALRPGDEVKRAEIEAEHAAIADAIDQVEREFLADSLAETTPAGLVRSWLALQAFRSRVREDDDG